MNTPPPDTDSSAYQQRPPHKEYEVASPKLKAFMVEDAQWERIHGRVQALVSKGGIDWLMGVATLIAGVAASAGLALLALPQATMNDGNLSPSVKPILWAVFIGGVFLAVAMALTWRHLRDNKTKVASDICNEMNTIQEAWQERESADGA